MKKYIKKVKNLLASKSFRLNLLAVFGLLAITFVNLRGFFRPGIFRGHDLENHLARIANFYLAIHEGHFPVRWARNLNFKFGYPVFNYLYPLANMLAYPLIVIGFNIENSLKIILFLAYLGSGLFFYLWAKKHFSQIASFIGAIFYLTAPYQFTDIYLRGIVGENLTFALFPAVLYFLDLLVEKKTRLRFIGLTLTTAMFSLSHNLMVLLFTPLILLYCLYVWLKKDKKNLKFAFISLILGFTLTFFFWLPAYFERHFINLNAFDQKTFYQDHFPTLKQLIYSPWQYGFSMAGDGDTMSFQIGPIHLLAMLLAVCFFVWQIFSKRKKEQTLLVAAIVLFCSAVFLMLPESLFIWKRISLLGYLQFPWRLLSLTVFAVALGAAIISDKNKWLGVVLALGALVYCQHMAKPFLWEKKDDMIYYDFLFTTSTRHEHMPKWFQEGKTDRLQNRFFSNSGVVNFRELEWKTAKHTYLIDVPRETYVWEHTAYFPGWQVLVDGKQTKVVYNHKDYPGLVGFKAPEGKHKIITRFTEKTPARITGDVLSILSLVAVLFLAFKTKVLTQRA